MNLVTYPDRELMMLDLANVLAAELATFLRSQDRVTFSVPGGTTPGPVYDVLCGLDLDWSRVSVLLNDERWVPESSERSNTRLIRARLLTLRAAAARLVPMYADTPEPEDAMAGLAAGIEPHLPISLLLLGMGADMHTASLFPGADRLGEALAANAPPVMALRASAAGEPRITLTAPVLKAAMSVHLLITGNEKRAALEKAQHLSEAEAPVRAVLAHATVHWAE